MQKKTDSDPVKQGDDFASQIRGAEVSISRVKEALIKAEAAKKPPFNWRNIIYTALIFASFLTIYRNLPEFLAISFTQKPLRAGSYVTDNKTDLCLANLWAVAAAMRSGVKAPVLVCPASGVPYIINKNSVFCPNPGLHGAAKLYADKKNVIPFLE